ncbi:MATE family efflux transporter [Butyricimonas paravirosa]|uniref:MATE family efflux transporter n=1 Tax=Butyricimonas paravirosa TaxID=1472417 RepID=UPI00210BE7DD|nr:MATE family efflux transporter [Butyricimonas paravirosa]MCQ4873330.1 MATE family efflux transporter [Butyricimonas paravirosa]
MKPKKTLRRQLFQLTGPIFVETLLIMLLGAMDTFMLSSYSDDTVAAVGVVNQLLNLVFLVFGVSTVGTSVLCSQYLGASQHANVRQVIGVSLLFNTLIGVMTSALLYFRAESLLKMMDLSPELVNEGLAYMQIVGGFAFLQAIALTMSAVLRSHNKAYYPMRVTLLMNILNIIGNYALIFGKFGLPQMGVVGAAISTSSCRGVALVLLLYITFGKVVPHFSFSSVRPFPWDKLKNLLHIGLPAAGEQVSYSLSQVVITYFTVMLGTAALTARTYAMNIILFSYVFSVALGQGAAILVGHLVGGDRADAAFVLQKYCLRLSIMVSISVAVITAACSKLIFGMLTANPEIIYMGVMILCIDVVLEVGRAVNILSVNVLNAVGDVTYPFVTGLIVMWGVATALSYVFGISFGWGLAGMWVAFTLDENIRAIIFVRRWNSRKWEGKTFTRVEKLLKQTSSHTT